MNKAEVEIITTGDGSHTLFSEQFNEIYHSRHGAIQESRHVYVMQGLDYVLSSPLGEDARRADGVAVRILEIGFGTGLNTLLTMLEAEKRNLRVEYTALELYPVAIETIKELNYTQQLGYEYCYGPYHSLHLVRWNEMHELTHYFSFKKVNESVFTYHISLATYHLIYFDAFAPNHQPEMWTAEVFQKMYDSLVPGGILVTYCSKGDVQRAMKVAGFTEEKLQGPPGKKEMLRAHKK